MIANYSLHVESLTDRERQMAQAVSRGLRNRQIADEFGISESTVKRHVEHILEKFNVDNRAAAVAVWQRMLDKAFGAT